MDPLRLLRVEPEDRVLFRVQDLSVSVKQKRKGFSKIKHDESSSSLYQKPDAILDGISFELGSGQLLAVMGGSGTGKSSLLNALSQRLNWHNKKLDFQGSIDYVQERPSKVKYGYLVSNDLFLPGLTVFETLKYQADLRLPPRTTEAEKLELVNSILQILELTHLNDTRISSFGTNQTHLSGGERRRVSLAIQLLSKSSILFLDEPTTGLDTSSSLKLMQLLRKFASPEIGITVILSIYQPRKEITHLFDKICLLTNGGRLVYYGDFLNAPSYFVNTNLMGEEIKKAPNAFDYILNLSSKDWTSKEKEEQTEERINKLTMFWKQYSNFQPCAMGHSERKKLYDQNIQRFSSSKNDKISFVTELWVLTRRVFLTSSRDFASILSLNGISLFFGVVAGWLFYKPGSDIAGIRSTTSCLYVIIEVLGFCPMYIEIERLWSIDGIYFLSEYKENHVSVPGFVLSRKIGKFLFEDLPMSIIFAILTYFMFGLRLEGDASYFFIYFAVTLLVSAIGVSSGFFLFALGPDFPVSSLLTNVFYQLQNNACGYFVSAGTIPVYVRWVKYIAYFWYAFGALTSNQYTGWFGDCPAGSSKDQCVQYSGDYQLEVLSFPKNWITEPIIILFAWYIGFNLIGGILLMFKNVESSVAKTVENHDQEKEDEETGEERNKLEVQDISKFESEDSLSQTKDNNDEGFELINDTCRDVDICVNNLVLSVKMGWYGRRQEKILLSDISTVFKSGTVNAIMGPSGSGKTTLLSYLAQRLSFRGKSSGEISLNNTQSVSPGELSKISAFVAQHDNSLLPRLTVRETLTYQAKLRLPVEEHPKIPQIINKLLREMEMVDSAETLVGSEFIKGVSSGTKKRLSIAIQLLSRSRVIFLDEPTSGLDTRSSISLLVLLNNLSKEGRTIILTIHQPNERIFNEFGTLLLLAKGGRVVYSDEAAKIRSYFNSIGLKVPEHENIADFALDFMSPGINEDLETLQRKVDGVVSRWKEVTSEKENYVVKNASNVDLSRTGKKGNFFQLLKTICSRQYLNTLRTKDAFISRAGQAIFIAAVNTLFFAPLRNGADGVNNRLGLVQEVMNLYFVGLVNNVSLFPLERNLFYQEYLDGLYGVSEFSISYLFLEIPIELITSFVFCALIVFGCGLPRNAGMYFTMLISSFVLINVGESLGIIVNSVFDHLGIALNVLSTLCIVAIFMGGTMSINMPSFFYGINYVNPAKYAVGLCSKLGFANQKFSCGSVECTLNTGTKVLEYYKLDIYFGGFMGGLIACLIAYRIIAIGSLYIKTKYFL